jgi:hypothetical protein
MGDTPEDLTDKCSRMLAEGFVTTGGIAVLPGPMGTPKFAQAMYRIVSITEEQARELERQRARQGLVVT